MKLFCAVVLAVLEGTGCSSGSSHGASSSASKAPIAPPAPAVAQVAAPPVVEAATLTPSMHAVAPAPSIGAAPRPDSVYVPILVYHGVFPHHPGQTADQKAFDVAPESFDAQMAYLRDNGYRVISLASFLDAMEKHDTIPPKSVVITLDDGRENQYVHAYPLLKKYGYTATFFVYPNPLARSHPDFMTWDQLREIQSAGMTIGSHTRTHPKLTTIHDPKQLTWELTGSRDLLEKNLHTKVDLLAFPYGLHNPQVDSMVKVAGYRAARVFPGGGWNSTATTYALRSFQITDNMTIFKRYLQPTPAHKAN